MIQSSPLELARAPALVEGSWRVPDRFNLVGDLVEPLGIDSKRQALTVLGLDGIIEPRTFRQLSEGAARWASILRSRGLEPGDRVLILGGLNEDWVEVVLGCFKAGFVAVPCDPSIPTETLESRVAVTDAALVVAGDDTQETVERMSFTPEVQHIRGGRRRRSTDVPVGEPTEATSSRDTAFVTWTPGMEGAPKAVAHTHGSLFVARAVAEHWLDVRTGDIVWCSASPGSALTVTTLLAGPWVHGAEVVVHEGEFDPQERLDLVRRIGPSILCQTPAELRALAELRQLARYRPPRLRRLVAYGDSVDPELHEHFLEAWGLPIHVAYWQAETGVVAVSSGEETEHGAIGAAVPGHHLGVIDGSGNELPHGVEGDLAVRGRPPTLFAGYWESPEETKRAFRGDWYVTGDVAVADADAALQVLGRSGEIITSRGRTFGPHVVERALEGHEAITASAVVGIRDLERGGQFVRAFVVLAGGIDGSEQLEAELRQFVGQTLLEQQIPREIVFVDELPTGPTGAIRRLELRELPVAGRPLWEAPPTTEPEPAPPMTVGVETSEPVAEPHAPPVAFVEPVAPEPAAPVEQEPPAVVEPEPVAFVESVAPEPAAPVEQEPAAVVEPEPVAFVEPAVPEAVEPVSPIEAEPVVPVEPVPVAFAEPEAVEIESPSDLVPGPEPELEEPSAEAEPAPVVELQPPPAPEPLPEYIKSPAESAAPRVEPPPPEPDEEEVDLGPLPEYIVDPDRPLRPVPPPIPPSAPEQAPTAASEEPPPDELLAGLARSQAIIPIREPEGDDESRPTKPRAPRRATPPPSRRRRGRSAEEPGDEGLADAMDGLSSRLSAYGIVDDASGSDPGEPDVSEDEGASTR